MRPYFACAQEQTVQLGLTALMHSRYDLNEALPRSRAGAKNSSAP